MNILTNKNILLGITGSIAAYKAADIVSKLKKENCNVKVIMTKSSELFITETTLESLSGNKVICEDEGSNTKTNFAHLDLAKWADMIVIAPCTANFMNKLANGLGEELLSTICLAFTKNIFVAPAMNPDMWNNKVCRESVKKLVTSKVIIIGPNYGSHACGDVGYGRMSSTDEVIEKIKNHNTNLKLSGCKILITAGPTREPIDPVRFLSNYSSGKMGYAMALAAHSMGAYVEVISGPVTIGPVKDVKTTFIETSNEMYDAVLERVEKFNIFISTAAIADYQPANYSSSKHKKNEENISIEFTRGIDILKTVSDKFNNIFTVGFAAETESLEENTVDKLHKKNLDIIVGNIANHELKLGFESDYNKVTIFSKTKTRQFSEDTKVNIALKILKFIASEYTSKVKLVNFDVK